MQWRQRRQCEVIVFFFLFFCRCGRWEGVVRGSIGSGVACICGETARGMAGFNFF